MIDTPGENLSNSKEHIITAKNISHTYKGSDRPVLSNVSFNVEKGELFGLIGPNGAGKTSLISILATILKPSAGDIQICGINLGDNPGEIRKRIGLIPQEIALYANLTGKENLYYYGTLYGIEKKQLQQEIEKYLEIFGLREKANSKVSTYSGGIKRRINILAGILHKPSLLLLDEPTVGIDAQSRNLIMENLIMLKNQGISMIYTTHYMEEIQKLCSKIAIIDGGRIIKTGNPKKLIDESDDCSDLSELFLSLTGKNLRD